MLIVKNTIKQECLEGSGLQIIVKSIFTIVFLAFIYTLFQEKKERPPMKSRQMRALFELQGKCPI